MIAEQKAANKSIRRILIALNTSPEEPPAIEVASLLAEKLEAELAGLFIEDINLLSVAELPFTDEILNSRYGRRELDVFQLQRMLAAEANKLRRQLIKQAKQKKILCSFSQVRGQLIREIVTAANEDDLLIISRGCQSSVMGDHPYDTISTIVSQARCPVLISGLQLSAAYPVYVVLDNESQVNQSLLTAWSIAEGASLSVNILIRSSDKAQIEKIRTACRAFLSDHKGDISIRVIDELGPMLNEMKRAYFVVLADGATSRDRAHLEELIHQVKSPILIVR